MATVDRVIQNTTASMDIVSGTLNSVVNHVVRGNNDRQHGAMGLIMGPVYSLVWKDLTAFVDSLLGLNIGDYCDFNKRMYGYMTRLMLINLWEKQTTLSTLGESAMNNGDANSISTPAQKPPYVEGNYYGDFINDLHEKNRVGVESTRRRLKDPQTHVYPDYDNLYPDDLGTGLFDSKWETGNPNSILYKTRELFKAHKIHTLISRFSTHGDGEEDILYNGKIDTGNYGESHGRNLLTKKAEEEGGNYNRNGYNNPYCRVWTHHHQYDRLGKLIRPFSVENEDGTFTARGLKNVHDWSARGWINDDEYLYKSSNNDGWERSVLDSKTGLLNITPKYTTGGKENVHTRDCMFSIENLAWKDYNPYSFEQFLSWEQRGPMGGRIMWFPPYGLTFNETTQVSWGSNTFIGRGEDVYTYTNTKRTGTLRFIMLTDHPSVIDYATWYGQDPKKKHTLKDTDIHRFFAGCDSVDATDDNSLLSYVKPTPLTDEYVERDGEAPVSKKGDKIPVQELPPQKVESVCFAVFFPNNYSGMYDSDPEYAVKYLLSGADAGKNDDGTDKIFNLGDGNGYEMVDNGITTDDGSGGVIVGNDYAWYKGCTKPYKRNDDKKWYYRIDGEYNVPTRDDKTKQSIYANTYAQTLKTKSDYKDTKSFKLNSSLDNSGELFKTFDKNSVYTFTEIVEALGRYKKDKGEYADFTSKFNTDKERVDKLVDVFTNLKLTEFKCTGMSNIHGFNKNNKTNRMRNEILAKERSLTIYKWFDIFLTAGAEINYKSEMGENYKMNGVSELGPKLYRSVIVELTFKSEKQEPQTNPYDEYDDYIGYRRSNEIIGEGKDAKRVYIDDNKKKWIEVSDGNFIEYDVNPSSIQARVKNGDYSFRLENVENADIKDKEGESDFNIYRFDQEYHFFKKMEQNNKPVFDTLMEKLRYFDPAFHSMTPEGFNARLTFLNQCTRQGNTLSTSDVTHGRAGNLAFGRPPFCVLRLGDFYNQMILIESINIDYSVSGGLVWDMNDEGVGVQPMLCEVSMNIVFIGGSDITGPVRRLQNAATFNYYANTRLYDNRADRMEYKTNWATMGGAGNVELITGGEDIKTAKTYYYNPDVYVSKTEEEKRKDNITNH